MPAIIQRMRDRAKAAAGDAASDITSAPTVGELVEKAAAAFRQQVASGVPLPAGLRGMDRLHTVETLSREGRSVKEIARIMGVTAAYVSRLRRQLGLTTAARSPRRDVRDELPRMPIPDNHTTIARWEWFERQPSSIKAIAHHRLAILGEVETLTASGLGRTIALEDIAAGRGIGVRTIQSWFARVRLVDRTNRLPFLAPEYATGPRGQLLTRVVRK